MTKQTLSSIQAEKDQRKDAISQVFALFKRNYHNQFFKAFSKESDLVSVKRLWFDALQGFPAHTIMQAALAVVKSSEYLPTLKTMLDHCESVSHHGLPDPHSAYHEACCATSPKSNYPWSHPAVFHCGKQVGWQFLHSSPESVAFPVFKQRYLRLCERIRNGEEVSTPTPTAIQQKKPVPASRDVRDTYMNTLRDLMK